jgi:hypothetical protein
VGKNGNEWEKKLNFVGQNDEYAPPNTLKQYDLSNKKSLSFKAKEN